MTMEPENVTEDAEDNVGRRNRVAKELGLEPDYVTDVTPGDDAVGLDDEDADSEHAAPVFPADVTDADIDAPAAGRHGREPVAAQTAAGTALGADVVDGDVDDGPLLDSTASLRESWQRIQAEFVDDPQASVREAAVIVTDLTETVVSTIQRREQRIRGSWQGNGSGVPGTGNTDTEQLRTTFRRYRAFFDQLTQI